MPLPSTRGAYRDIEATLDTILRYDAYPVDIAFGEPRLAAEWVRRACKFRTILRREEEQRLSLPSGSGSSIYDMLVFRRPERGSRVTIAPRAIAPTMTIPGIGEVRVTTDDDLALGEEIEDGLELDLEED